MQRDSRECLLSLTKAPDMVKMQQQQTMKTTKKPSIWQIYKTAARPHTLTASLCPCLVAYTASASSQNPPVVWPHWCLWVLFCMTVQLGTNFHNDYADFVQGADTMARVGQKRATAQGWLTPEQTCRASCICLGITATAGAVLLRMTRQLHNGLAWFLVLSSILNAFAYTAGPFPLGYVGMENWSIAYAGLGEVFVLLYFGWVAVLFLPYLLSSNMDNAEDNVDFTASTATSISWKALWLYATQVGLLATNIIVVNNLRDRHTDARAKKLTTAVRFGKRFCLAEYVLCLMVTYSLVAVDLFWAIRDDTCKVANGAVDSNNAQQHYYFFRLLPLLSFPLAWKEMKNVFRKEGAALNEHVGGAAKVQVAFCSLLSAGLVLYRA